uniref:Uncharacterized protein n=1 Tax=Rhizophora mucronata TaxID=61149 RepID=A0A2P2ILU6_RHIMU
MHEHSFEGNQSFQNSELNHIVSAATSTTRSPTVGLTFPFGNVEFDPNFTFDSPGFLD